jgi:hypothetical protein
MDGFGRSETIVSANPEMGFAKSSTLATNCGQFVYPGLDVVQMAIASANTSPPAADRGVLRQFRIPALRRYDGRPIDQYNVFIWEVVKAHASTSPKISEDAALPRRWRVHAGRQDRELPAQASAGDAVTCRVAWMVLPLDPASATSAWCACAFGGVFPQLPSCRVPSINVLFFRDHTSAKGIRRYLLPFRANGRVPTNTSQHHCTASDPESTQCSWFLH